MAPFFKFLSVALLGAAAAYILSDQDTPAADVTENPDDGGLEHSSPVVAAPSSAAPPIRDITSSSSAGARPGAAVPDSEAAKDGPISSAPFGDDNKEKN